MFSIILSIGSVASGLMYLKNQNQTQFPDINAFFFTIMYNLIYVFSFLQIKCIKVFKFLTEFLAQVNPIMINEIRSDNKPYIISQKYKNGKKLLNNTNSNLEELEADLVIIKENNLSLVHLCISKTPALSVDLSDKCNSYHALEKCEGVINPLTTQESSINIMESNVRFIALTMIYNGESYKLNLKTPDYNFYVVGNKIDKSFLQYYLVNILFIPFLNEVESEAKDEVESEAKDELLESEAKDELLESEAKDELLKEELKARKFVYILEVMDNDVNYIYLNETQYILLDLDNYSLH
jgi:hypothetical protein